MGVAEVGCSGPGMALFGSDRGFRGVSGGFEVKGSQYGGNAVVTGGLVQFGAYWFYERD